MKKLSECNPNDEFSIKYLDGNEDQKRHLQNLGFIPASIIKVTSVNKGDMIVKVFDSTIAINKEISDHIHGIVLKKENDKQKHLSRHNK